MATEVKDKVVAGAREVVIAGAGGEAGGRARGTAAVGTGSVAVVEPEEAAVRWTAGALEGWGGKGGVAGNGRAAAEAAGATAAAVGAGDEAVVCLSSRGTTLPL